MTEGVRVFNGRGYRERYSTCQACPIGTFSDEIGASSCHQCPIFHRTRFQGSSSGKDCFSECLVNVITYRRLPAFWSTVDPLLMECDSEGTGNEVTIDCQTNRPPASVLCSFDGGLVHQCKQLIRTYTPGYFRHAGTDTD